MATNFGRTQSCNEKNEKGAAPNVLRRVLEPPTGRPLVTWTIGADDIRLKFEGGADLTPPNGSRHGRSRRCGVQRASR